MIEHLYENPFDFFQELGDFYRAKGYSEAAHNRIQRYEILLEFLQDEKQQDEAFFRQMMVLDLYARENMKTRPRFAKDPSEWKNESRDFYQKESETRTQMCIRDSPDARTYVWEKIKKNYYDQGAKLFWLDVAEPEYSVYDFKNYRYQLGSVQELSLIHIYS